MLRYASLFVLVVSFCGATLQADVLYDSNGFESPGFDLGSIDGQDSWTGFPGAGAAQADMAIQSTLTESGSQALFMANSDHSNLMLARKEVATPDDFWFSFSARPPALADTGNGNAAVLLRGSSNSTIYLYIAFDRYSNLINGIAGATYASEEWNDIVVHVKRNGGSGGSYDLYINEELKASDATTLFTNTTHIGTDFDIQYVSKDGAEGGLYVDNFQVTTHNPIPEPGAMGLFSLAMCLLASKRSRSTR